jgi:signal transduction histidine kinase
MNHLTITRHAVRLHSYLSSRNLTGFPAPVQLVQEKPAQFTSMMAHEIRNPVTNIKLAVQMLKSLITDNYQRMYLDIILRGSEQVNTIVTGLLTSAKSDENEPKKYSLHQLLDETLAMNKDRIILKNIKVRKLYDVNDYELILNGPQMKIALTNIIINAIDAMPLEKGELKLVTKSVNGRCCIEISDNGIGISKKDLASIFQPYFTKRTGGLGLGLANTLDILFSNHARVDVQSEEGTGTQFTLLFDKKTDRYPV